MLWHIGVFLELGVALLCPGICKRCLDSPTMAAKRTPFGTGFTSKYFPSLAPHFWRQKQNKKKWCKSLTNCSSESARLSFSQSRRYRSKVCRQRLMEGTLGVTSKDFFSKLRTMQPLATIKPRQFVHVAFGIFKHDLSGFFPVRLQTRQKKCSTHQRQNSKWKMFVFTGLFVFTKHTDIAFFIPPESEIFNWCLRRFAHHTFIAFQFLCDVFGLFVVDSHAASVFQILPLIHFDFNILPTLT